MLLSDFDLQLLEGDFKKSYCPDQDPGSHRSPLVTKMTDCPHLSIQSFNGDFSDSYCPVKDPGSHRSPLVTKMTDCSHLSVQSINRDFIDSYCSEHLRAVDEQCIEPR